jgi:predicted anti-sigma-YlaC factor YlaD
MARGLLVFLLIMAVETVHGVLRGLFLAPRVGEEMAGRIGWPVALVLVLLIAWATIRWIGLRGTRELVALGAAWAVLTIAFEVMIGMLRGMGMPEIMAELNPLTGTIPYSAAVMLIAPWAAARLRGLV